MNTGHPWIPFIITRNPAVLETLILDAPSSSEEYKLDGLNPGLNKHTLHLFTDGGKGIMVIEIVKFSSGGYKIRKAFD
jgi:hypothetical protein